MAGQIAQPRNQALDMVDAANTALPLLFGKNSYSNTQTSADVTEIGRSRSMIDMLMSRSSSTAQADKIVEDILYRAQLAFAPILGEEKSAGVYNSTVKSGLARESIARATAASADAVLKDQQAALQTAAQLQNSNTQATKSTATANKQPGQAANALGLVALLNAPALLKKAQAAGKGAPKDEGPELLGGPEDSVTGTDGVETTDLGVGATPLSGNADGLSSSFDSGDFVTDDTAALQSILDSVTIPGISDGVNVADAGTSTTDVGAGVGEIGGITASQVVTPLPMPPAVQINPITGEVIPSMPPAVATMPPAIGIEDAGIDLGAEATGDVGAEAGSEIATEAISEAGGEIAGEVGGEVAGEAVGDFLFPGAFTVANLATEGALGEGVGNLFEAGGDSLGLVAGESGSLQDIFEGFADQTTNAIDEGVSYAEDFFSGLSDSFGCFMTTAATRGGEVDNGRTLQTMRKFRDTYMHGTFERKAEVIEYYYIAPNVVRAVEKLPNADEVWAKVRKEYLEPCVAAFNSGRPDITHTKYQEMMVWAKAQTGVQ